MSLFKECKVVMLPTNEKAPLCISANELCMYFGFDPEVEILKHQHLYFISDDKIKEGDWYIDNTEEIRQSITSDKDYWKARQDYKKIIATTDSNLSIKIREDDGFRARSKSLPQPSQAFIEKYVEQYNKSNIIIDVLVEYNFKKNVVFGNMSFLEINNDGSYYKCINCEVETSRSRKFLINHGCIVDELKVNPKDNTINIKQVKDSWSRNEVVELLFEVWHMKNITKERFCSLDKWIEENL